MQRALEGIKVLELTTMITGPLAGAMLADFGAEVIKVERPDGGDPFRSFRGGLYSPHFRTFNRNKRGIAIDLRSEEGRDVVLKIAESADVVLENFRPGVLDRLGLGIDKLRARNPKLIYASITGFGEDGPYKDRPAYDAVAQALSGLMSQFMAGEKPRPMGPTISDNLTGVYLCYGIMAALFERARTGVARRVDVNMLEATIGFMPDPFANLVGMGIKTGPQTRVAASQSYTSLCKDGKILAIHLSSQPKFWEGLLKAIDRPDLGKDARFETRNDRIDNYTALADEFDRTLGQETRAHWMVLLEANDVPFAPVNTPEEVMEDPQVKHLEMFYEAEHPTEGMVHATRRPVLIDGSWADQPRNPPPTLSEHTEEVLAEYGFSAADISGLREQKII